MTEPLPIYVRSRPVETLSVKARLVALTIALGCLALLVVATWLSPDPHGMGTHTQLGLKPCGMMELFGIPCPTCGYTTSFSWFVRGHWLASFITQPGGFATALVTGITFWVAFYVVATGKPIYRLLTRWVTSSAIFGMGFFYLLAWGAKVAMVLLSRNP